MSGGERQLVAIARALAPQAKVLLLDEPFSALDPRRRMLVRRTVRAIAREQGITVLQVTHDFTEAGLLGDVAILIDQGRVLQHGPPERLFRDRRRPTSRNFSARRTCMRERCDTWATRRRMFSMTRRRSWRAGITRSSSCPEGLTLYTMGDAPPGAGHAVIRAEEVLVSAAPQSSSARNQFEGVVSEVATTGALTRVTVDVRAGRVGVLAPACRSSLR